MILNKHVGILIVFILLFPVVFINPVISVSSKIPVSQIEQDTLFASKEYRAVLVAIGLSMGLPFSIRQIQGFKTTLLNSGHWKEENIRVLLDEKASKSSISNSIQWLAENADDNDLSLFYFVGHGGKNLTNEFIRAHDKAIYDVELDQYFHNVSGSIVVILESCYSGGFIEELKGSQRVIITACAKDEITYQVQDLKSGMFGYFFNISLSLFTKNAENSFLLTRFFTWYYGRKLSYELNSTVSIHPQMYDGIIGPTRIISRHSYINKISDLFRSFMQINKGVRIWEMNNKTI